MPAHREMVLGALAAGKHVLCEYPLGRNVAEAEEMAAAAKKAGVHAAIGLQLRSNPATAQARQLIESGAIGRVLGARILSTTMAFGDRTEEAMAFAEKPENGVTLVSIQGGHTLDLAVAVLGGLADLSALASTRYPMVVIKDGLAKPRVIPDHLLVTARLADGAPVSVEVAGGRPAHATPFRFDISGERGTLTLKGGAPRGVQSGVLRVSLDGREQPVEAARAIEPDTAANVAGLYAALHDDILNSTRIVPDFDHAAAMACLVEDVLAASRNGARMPARGWPQL